MEKLVECVPNFSEGRNQAVLQAIAEKISAVEGVKLLDYSADYDHNRSVYTIVGQPQAVSQSIFAAAAYALEHIDLSKHQGKHPRIGAVDVIPFIPYRNMNMAEAADVAINLGKRFADELAVPVYLYEEAAQNLQRKNLADIRRGGFEGLAAKMTDALWRPDFGPAKPHPTFGATVIGARWFLIAYNVNLKSNDITIAKAIAKKIRQSSGGLPNVKALGIMLEKRNIVQVSCNLTDYRITPIHIVYEAIKKEAAVYGVEVLESEIIGLPPLQAIIESAAHYLKLEDFKASDVLEDRMTNV
ncbi:MAG: glutamate formimidoyltransferase [Bacillota bacterium]|jgi:glutamate formiminotransferase